MNNAKHERELDREPEGSIDARAERSASFGRTALWVLVSAACYYLSTQIAWALCFPDSKVSLFFPPHAVLVSVLLLVPTRHWWAYTLAAISAHFLATQQAHWPFFYALHCEAFDAVQNVATAAGLRLFIKSPLKLITLRDAIVFVLIAVVIVPFGTAFWGAAFTVSNHFGTRYWVEWRNLGISNGVTAVVLLPAILFGVRFASARRVNATPVRWLEAGLLGASILTAGFFAFDKTSAGPDVMPILLYAPIPLLIWAALRFGLGGVSAAMLAITFQAIWGTMHGHGPFLTQTPAENALALQIFLMVMAIPLMFLSVVVEEGKRSQDKLRESEERMIMATEAAEFGVWVWNVTSNQIWGTAIWRRLFGFASGESIGFENLFQKIHPEDRETMEQEIKCAAAGEADHLREYRIILPDGTQRWIASRGRMREDVAGKTFRMFGVAIDITERRRAEENLRQFSLAVDQSPVLMMVTDLTGKIVYVNRKFSEVTGYSFAEVLGQNPRILKSGECPPALYQELWACITSGKTWRGEFRNRKKNGELYWESAVISPLFDAAGRATHFVGIKEDITGRMQTAAVLHDLSRRLIRAHEAERARLGRELHDDVTQRLAILAIDAGRVERGVDKNLAVETMRKIREGLVRLSEDIHALSYRLHPALLEDLGLAEALKAECERFSRQESVPADVTLRNVPDDIPADVALCLYRVAQESLRNAARHAKARRLEVSVYALDDGLQLAVHDDGIGFDPASQRTRPSLGLESMRERVFLVDGELDIESAPGRGTTIMVTVPLKKAEVYEDNSA